MKKRNKGILSNKGFELSAMIGIMIAFVIFLIIIVILTYRSGIL